MPSVGIGDGATVGTHAFVRVGGKVGVDDTRTATDGGVGVAAGAMAVGSHAAARMTTRNKSKAIRFIALAFSE